MSSALICGVAAGRLLTGATAVAVALVSAAPQPALSMPVVPPTPDVAVGYVVARGPDQRPATVPASRLAVLQMNLCSSGLAGCYAGGRSVPEAATVVGAERPDVVTLNEVCRGDGRVLLRAMERTWPGDRVFEAFTPAWDRRRQAPYRCANGAQYGIEIMGHVPPGDRPGVGVRGGSYHVQVADSDEARVWMCVSAGTYQVCTTHLAAESAGVALAQCHYLMDTAIPRAWTALGGYAPTAVSGDLNLRYGGTPDVQDCVPTGWSRKGDGALQHVMATNDMTVRSTRRISMRQTDHDAWLVTLDRGQRRPMTSTRSRPGGTRARRVAEEDGTSAVQHAESPK